MRTRCRASRIAEACPSCTAGRRNQSDAGVAMFAVVPGEERLGGRRGRHSRRRNVREVRAVLQRFELGLAERVLVASIRRLCVCETPRSASCHAIGLDVMEEPRSACRVNCPVPICGFSQVSLMSRWASTADSAGAIIQPTTYRLKISRMT